MVVYISGNRGNRHIFCGAEDNMGLATITIQ